MFLYMSYFERFKDAVQTSTSTATQDVKDFSSLLQRVRQIESNVNALMQWKDSDAIPTMNNNIADIRNIYTNIQTSVLPKIEDNVKEIRDAVAQISKATNIALEASALSESASEKVSNALNKAIAASDTASKAADLANIASFKASEVYTQSADLLGKFQKASAQLKKDTEDISATANALAVSFGNEITNIKNQFLTFGGNVYTRSKAVATGMNNIGSQMVSAVSQIEDPLNWVIEYARRVREHPLIFAPYNIWKTIWWGFIK